MSIHKSLVTKGRLRRHRNVLSRLERVLKLEEEERWAEDDDSVFALPKVRVARLKKSHAKKKEAKEEELAEGVEGAEAAPAAEVAATETAPSKGAKPAKGAKSAKK